MQVQFLRDHAPAKSLMFCFYWYNPTTPVAQGLLLNMFDPDGDQA